MKIILKIYNFLSIASPSVFLEPIITGVVSKKEKRTKEFSRNDDSKLEVLLIMPCNQTRQPILYPEVDSVLPGMTGPPAPGKAPNNNIKFIFFMGFSLYNQPLNHLWRSNNPPV